MGSGIGQTNERVHEGQVPQRGSYRSRKAAKKSWFLDHGEEMLALRTQALPEDGRWDDYFERLRRGEVEIPTRRRMGRIPVFPPKEDPAMEPAA